MSESSLKKFLAWEAASRDTIDFKKCYVDVSGGDIIAGLLLSQIIFWFLPSKNEGESKIKIYKEGKYWLAKKRTDWFEECRISAKQYDRAVKILSRFNFIYVKIFKFAGVPVPHLSLNFVFLLPALEKIIEEKKQGKSTFTRKSTFTKGQNPLSQKRNMHLDEKLKSIYTEITAENTTTDAVAVELIQKIFEGTAYSKIQPKKISELIKEKGFNHVLEIAEILVYQLRGAGAGPRSAIAHFIAMCRKEEVDIPPGFISSDEKARRQREQEEQRKLERVENEKALQKIENDRAELSPEIKKFAERMKSL